MNAQGGQVVLVKWLGATVILDLYRMDEGFEIYSKFYFAKIKINNLKGKWTILSNFLE